MRLKMGTCMKHLLLSAMFMECLHPFCSAGILPPVSDQWFARCRWGRDKCWGTVMSDETIPVQAAANAVDDIVSMWPHNTIPYEFSTQRFAGFGLSERKTVEEAMELISIHTGQCVKFVRRRTEKDYVRFQKGMQSFSDIGRTGDKQVISLSRGCLARYGCIQHEIMHILGFFHEQSRMDRDNYVFVNLDNVAEKDHSQFEKRTGLTYSLPYDYESVMHYEFNAFAKDSSLPTILPKSGRWKLGQQEDLSPLDVVRIYKRLKCIIPSAKTFLGIASATDQHLEPSNNRFRDEDATGPSAATNGTLSWEIDINGVFQYANTAALDKIFQLIVAVWSKNFGAQNGGFANPKVNVISESAGPTSGTKQLRVRITGSTSSTVDPQSLIQSFVFQLQHSHIAGAVSISPDSSM